MHSFKSLFFGSLRLIALLFLCSIVIFAFISANPVDTISANYGTKVASSLSSEQLVQLKSYWGTDVPFIERYLTWLTSIVQGDLGMSLIYNDSVLNVIANRGLSSIFMIGIAWIISSLVGYFLGVYSGFKKDALIDKIITKASLILASTPTFWIGMLLLFIFAVTMKVFPIGFANSIAYTSFPDMVWHAFLPAATLSIMGISNVAMHTRQKTIDVMNTDYIKHAKNKGEHGFLLVKRHVLRNVSIPCISIQFAQISEIISGSVVVETVFSYPGLGNTLVGAATGGDANLLAGIALLCTIVVFAGNCISNLIVAKVDPRIE